MDKLISYWLDSAEEDILTAKVLLDNGRLLSVMFYCHLALEKGLKGAYVKTKGENAPKTHNLLYLAKASGLFFENKRLEFLGVLMTYQITGRYPDIQNYEPELDKIEEYFEKTKEILAWIKQQL